MFGKRRLEELIAAGLYEPLTEAEQAERDALLARHPAYRGELDAMTALVADIPVREAPFEGDLVPALREQLHAGRGYSPVWRVVYGAAAALVLFAAVGLSPYFGFPANAPATEIAQRGPVLDALDRADALIGEGEFVRAYQLLEQTVRRHPADPATSTLRQRMAETAFDLRWYDKAHEAYAALRANHNPTFQQAPLAVDRFQLLSEAAGEQFASLEALDAADRDVGALEQFLARHPGRLVASVAAARMGEVVAAETRLDDPVLALEQARDRCSHPVAVAQLNLELGQQYLRQGDGAQRARDVFTAVAQSGNGALAEQARAHLAAMHRAGR